MHVTEKLAPGGLSVKLAGVGIGSMEKLVVAEHPLAAVTVTFVMPELSPLTLVCVGVGGPGGTGLQVTV
jgi:hypothetical protein